MNPIQKSLSDRMKEYEKVSNARLVKRMPIMVRLDGRAFHTFTKKMKKPYDLEFMELMDKTTEYLMENTPDCKIAYVESDEITLGIFPYSTFTTEPMFDARIQKLCSVLAATATWYFNHTLNSWISSKDSNKREFAEKLIDGIAMFDARTWNLPREEVLNCFLWRQQDSKRNAILSAGQTWIGKKAINGLKCPEVIDKLLKEKHVDYWDNIPSFYHYGRTFTSLEDEDTARKNVWIFDKKEDRELLETLVNCDA